MSDSTQAITPVAQAAATPAPIDPASIAAPPALSEQAARKKAPTPEHQATTETGAQASVMPPRAPELPKPPINMGVIPSGEAANDAYLIEKNIARYIGENLAHMPQGAVVDEVLISDTTPVTAMRNDVAGLKDVGIKIKGITPELRQKTVFEIDGLLRSIKGFEKVLVQSPDQKSLIGASHSSEPIYFKLIGLSELQLMQLTSQQIIKKGTLIVPAAHTCTGANCSHCATHKETAEVAAQAIAEKPAHEHHQVADHAGHTAHAVHGDHHAGAHPEAGAHSQTAHPHAQEHAHAPHAVSPATAPAMPNVAPAAAPAASAAAHVTPVVAPVTQVAAPEPVVGVPVHHQGVAASNDNHMRIGA